MPTLRQLRYFLALLEHGHFGRAASACSVSQPAFSHAIRELEDNLGSQLVDRTQRSVTITAAGQDIAAQARLCIQDVDALIEMSRAGSEPLSGKLVLGVIPTIAPFILPRVLPALHKQHPELQLFLQEEKTAVIYERLLKGSIDVLLLALPWPMRSTETCDLFQDPFHLAYHRNTQLIDPENFSLNRLTAESVMLLEDGHCLRDHALSACRINRTDSINRFAASSLQTLLEMVNADLGVTFIPEMAINSGMLKGTRIKTRPMAKGNSRKIGMAWRKGSARAEEFRLLGEIIRQHA